MPSPPPDSGSNRLVDSDHAVGPKRALGPCVARVRTPPVTSYPTARQQIRVSEVLAALSHALDLTEGQPPGHTLRSCLIGMRLAEELGLDASSRSSLYYALLLKDGGCSSNAARMSALFGSDDRAVKPSMKLADWHHRLQLAVRTAHNAAIGQPLRARVQRFIEIARTPDVTRELIRVRCDRGADIALSLGFSSATAAAIRSLDEHWNGAGYPSGLGGVEIPMLARIANLAQVVEVFHREHGLRATLRMARKRSGRWFDPALVRLLLRWRKDGSWWASLGREDIRERVLAAEPSARAHHVDEATIDQVAEAFAGIIDAKSPYTSTHSSNVARYARGTARSMGATAEQIRRLHRAGLLHDIGKLGISNTILDKTGPLTTEERGLIELHPLYTWDILSHIRAFSGFARIASLHHEKLDGSGYPWGLEAADLDWQSRVLCVADIYEALTADRPYRAGLPPTEAFAILTRDAGTRLCGDAIAALESYVATQTERSGS